MLLILRQQVISFKSPLTKGDFVVSSVERFRGLCFSRQSPFSRGQVYNPLCPPLLRGIWGLFPFLREISRSRNPPLTPPKRGIVELHPKSCPQFQSGRGIIHPPYDAHK